MTPGELVRCVASAFDVPETIVAQHDRRLAEEGFRTKGGRGASAPQVTVEDAAKLIIAMLAGERFSQTFATVRDLWNARTDGVAAARDRWTNVADKAESGDVPNVIAYSLPFRQQIKTTLGEFENAIANGCSFGEALVALLTDCISGQMTAFLRHGDMTPRERFQLVVKRPSAYASFRFRHPVQKAAVELEFRFVGATDSDVNREILTTHEVSIIPLQRIAERFRA